MNVYNILKSSKFTSLSQFERRNIVKDVILNEKDCIINTTITCFENEILSSSVYFYNKATAHDVCDLTIGKEYKIIDYNKKRKLIKIKNDSGLFVWTTYKRFVLTISNNRKMKLLKINN